MGLVSEARPQVPPRDRAGRCRLPAHQMSQQTHGQRGQRRPPQHNSALYRAQSAPSQPPQVAAAACASLLRVFARERQAGAHPVQVLSARLGQERQGRAQVQVARGYFRSARRHAQ